MTHIQLADVPFSAPPPPTSDSTFVKIVDKARNSVRKAPTPAVIDVAVEDAESALPAHALPSVPKRLDIPAVADLLDVSTSWVRRHLAEIPHERLGRLIRFDPVLLSRWLKERMQGGKSLKPERAPMPSRYQRGYVYQSGKRKKVWYGMYREDIRTPNGQIERRQHKVRLGTLVELPTKNAAREHLAEILGASAATIDMSVRELTERWERAEGPTMKSTTLGHYRNALNAYILPTFGDRKIGTINREEVQTFLARQASRYSKSSLRSMKVVLMLTFGWASDCGWVSNNPCRKLKLPRLTAGRKVTRTFLRGEQIVAIAAKLPEPYATLVLFIAVLGLRIGEAVAVKFSDFEDGVLHVSRRIYEGDEDDLKTKRSERNLPVPPALMARIEMLGPGDWVFRSRAGTPVNPGNALKRVIRPVAKELGIQLGGWHDFRHTLSTTMRRNNVHPKVISGTLGHVKVTFAPEVYDHASVDEMRQPLAAIADQLLPTVTKNDLVN